MCNIKKNGISFTFVILSESIRLAWRTSFKPYHETKYLFYENKYILMLSGGKYIILFPIVFQLTL